MKKSFIIFSQFRAEGNAPQQLSLPLASVPQAELFSHKLQIPSIPGIPPVIPCDRCGKVQVLEGRCVGCGVEQVANSLWKYFPNVGYCNCCVGCGVERVANFQGLERIDSILSRLFERGES
jgi:hypothetical protein